MSGKSNDKIMNSIKDITKAINILEITLLRLEIQLYKTKKLSKGFEKKYKTKLMSDDEKSEYDDFDDFDDLMSDNNNPEHLEIHIYS